MKRFRIGPATVIALMAAIVIATVQWPMYQKRAAEQQAMEDLRRQVNERKGQKAPDVKPKPTLDALLARRAELKLTRQQISELEKLRAEEKQLLAPLQSEAERAGREFKAWMDDAQKRGGATMQDIQQRSAPLSEASAAVAKTRRSYFNTALPLLSGQQRTQAERLFQ